MRFLNRFSSALSPHQRRLVLLAPAVCSLVFFACGGSVATSGAEPSAKQAGTSPGAYVPPPTSAANPEAGSDSGTPTVDASVLVEGGEECILTGGGGSSGTGGSCTTGETYTCTSGEVEIECSCPAAQCNCGGQVINAPSACTGGCSVPASVRAQCGAINIVKDDGGGSSSGATSSGGSSGGSSSSTGGK